MVDALDSSNGKAKGIAFVARRVTDDDLEMDEQAGVKGVRFNFVEAAGDLRARGPGAGSRGASPPLGWHIVIYFEMPTSGA